MVYHLFYNNVKIRRKKNKQWSPVEKKIDCNRSTVNNYKSDTLPIIFVAFIRIHFLLDLTCNQIM